MKCLNCKKEYESKRTDAKFCSASCRLKYFRETDKLPVIETDIETDNSKPLETDKYKPLEYPEHLKTYTDHCNFCNHKFGKASDGEQMLGWICADCISKEMKANEAVD